ncbi:SH3 domain-containing protein [Hymenobacter sp. GOD-10R]|uniref:SH3 domain-containing protein n=1 Tax=Hymenobacter sp. GOD-10R TaxID=3093922 RepID=UPI002D78C46A|nr:SH3 domain-containing protein [Hymenobacter sp. GOD-10R]WRQ27671.1 SH3 domain-containing protein [Hymenobacter sp. GOD-10R]
MKPSFLFWLLCLLPFIAPAQRADQTALVLASQSSLPYRYVNASSLILRAQPSATSSALAKLAGASRVQIRDVCTDGWSEIQAHNYTGYVKSSYLVDGQQEVTAETIDWDMVQSFGGTDYTGVTAVPVPTSVSTPAASHVSARKPRQ